MDNRKAIYLDDAINAVAEGLKRIVVEYRDVAEKMLNKLPSALPEIIHCEDCKHYNAGFECLIEGYGIERNKDWFCGDAERRQDDQRISN